MCKMLFVLGAILFGFAPGALAQSVAQAEIDSAAKAIQERIARHGYVPQKRSPAECVVYVREAVAEALVSSQGDAPKLAHAKRVGCLDRYAHIIMRNPPPRGNEEVVEEAIERRALPGGILYVKIRDFRKDVSVFFMREVFDPPQGLVLDLRGNLGGFLLEGIYVAEEFAQASGALMLYEREKGGDHPRYTTRRGFLAGVPTVILIDRNTASAAELVAGAARFLGKGKVVLVGTRSFGKGMIQMRTAVGNLYLFLSVGEYLIPLAGGRGLRVEGIGLFPDHLAPSPKGEVDYALTQALRLLRR